MMTLTIFTKTLHSDGTKKFHSDGTEKLKKVPQ